MKLIVIVVVKVKKKTNHFFNDTKQIKNQKINILIKLS